MFERFTDRARKVMQLANQEAQRFQHEYIGTEHILLGLVKEASGVAANVLKNLGVDLRKIRLEVEKIVQSGPDPVTMGKLPQTPRAKKVIDYSMEEARNLGHNYVGTEHILLGLLREEEGVAAQVLMNLGLRLADVREEVLNLLGRSEEGRGAEPSPGSGTPSSAGTAKLPAVEVCSTDLTELARKDKLAPLVGRQAEIARIVLVLMRRKRNSVLLVGESRFGRRAVAEGVARQLCRESAVEPLAGARLLAVDVPWMAATTAIDLQWPKVFLQELGRPHNLILFLDDMPALWSAPDTAARTLSRALQSAMLRGRVRCIAGAAPGSASSPEAETYQWAFENVPVGSYTVEETIEVLRGLRAAYGKHHHVEFTDAAIEAAGRLSASLPGCLPEKAIDLLDEAGARVRLASTTPPPDVVEIDDAIARLNRQKEEAVANSDFEAAAALRDEADKLKKRKVQILADWQATAAASKGVVDQPQIADVVADRTARPPASP